MIYINNDSEQYQNVYIPRTVIVTGGTNHPFDPADYWTSGQTEDYVEEQLSAYTPTNDFATINGEPITEGGNIEVSPSYTAGDNIDITNNVISVTGITEPTKVSDLENDSGFITEDALSGYAESSAVTQEISQAVSGLAEQSAVTQQISDATSGLAESSAVTAEISAATSGLAESSAVTQEINNAVSGLAESSAVTQEINQAVSGLAESSAVTAEISAATSGLAESSAVTQEISNAVSGKADSSAVTQEISTALSAYTPTSGFSTINGSAITNGGDITISGGSGAGAVEMTQAQYDALSGNVSADTFYVITDATPIDMNDYATTATVSTLSGQVSDKADKQSVTANTSDYKFPTWNSQGVITGENATAQQKQSRINDIIHTFYGTNNNQFEIYAPTTSGNEGQLLVSNGSSLAPVWQTILSALGVDFWVGSQTAYDNMASHLSTRLYIIDPTL